MSNLELEGGPRDVRVDRNDDSKYQFLRGLFNVENDKDIFLLALKVGYFNKIREPLSTKPLHKWQLSTFSENDKKEMVVISNAGSKDFSTFLDGAKVIKTSEEYANAGIKFLYNLFTDEVSKDNIRIIEDFLEQIKDKIDKKLFFVR